ncbi:hypothetical protein B5M09_009493 [Aphanomyces astaci]|uniref:Uncharacterized protein n=1 Tax=Aphanomyces astaci TaxID=112090 RepID=A0A3R7YI33_APHAT|nr:hypothetical protein B5M09_009493 [Aphanomyces astaci]
MAVAGVAPPDNKAVTNVVVAFLEVVASILRLQHTGAALSRCLQTAAVAIENPVVIKALQRILRAAASACESATVIDSVASSLEAASTTLKHERSSGTVDACLQLALKWCTFLLQWVHSFLEQEQLTELLDAFAPVASSVRNIVQYTLSYPLVAYVAGQVHTHAITHLSSERLFALLHSSHTALSKAHAITSGAWSYVVQKTTTPEPPNPARRHVHHHLLKRCNTSHALNFSAETMEYMLSTHEAVQVALLEVAVEQASRVHELELELLESTAYATEMAEALAKGPVVVRRNGRDKNVERIRALEAELMATTAFANELAEAIARGPTKRLPVNDPFQAVMISESFSLHDTSH